MTTLAFSRGWSRQSAAARSILLAVIEAATRVRNHVRVRQDQHHLRGLPGYLLKDIGMAREEIEIATVFGRSRLVHRLGAR